ncbi:uncharacterized protein [Nicotiana sylvestris]|uniref:uncharacterized protein n=1 Tax=Nicotiana sylvestris TaxID=4096 RepID=UPI00388C5D19
MRLTPRKDPNAAPPTLEKRKPKKEKNRVLKADNHDSSEEDSDMAYLTKRFQKMVRKNGEMLKRGSSNKSKNNNLCYKYGKAGHFMKNCPLLKQEFSKNFKRKRSADNVVKRAFASGKSKDETDTGDSSMMASEGKENEYESTFALMAQPDDDEDDDNKEDRDSLTLELAESKQTRDDLMAVVSNHKKPIEIFRKEKNDLLAEITDLRETIVKPEIKSKPENFGKGKERASEEHIRLENELKAARTRICGEFEKNRQLQDELKKVKRDLEKYLKWTWSSDAVTAMYFNNSGNR